LRANTHRHEGTRDISHHMIEESISGQVNDNALLPGLD
jgi:hypothetical protein